MFVATIQPLKFQSTLPRGERRHEVQQQTQVRDFNPRSHEGSDCGKGLQRSTTLLFQSTLPRGERLPIPQRQSERILFQSTLPRGERHGIYNRVKADDDFNPRSHEGSDVHRIVYRRSICTDFNPRSHEGSDTAAKEIFDALDISIHAPTRGATC